jgi:hypothetical protein
VTNNSVGARLGPRAPTDGQSSSGTRIAPAAESAQPQRELATAVRGAALRLDRLAGRLEAGGADEALGATVVAGVVGALVDALARLAGGGR